MGFSSFYLCSDVDPASLRHHLVHDPYRNGHTVATESFVIESTLETDAGRTFLLIKSVCFDLLSLREALPPGGTVSGSEESGEWESQAC